MVGPQLTDEIRAELREKFGHRFPEVAVDIPIGNEKITFVVGNPSATCKLGEGEVGDPAWSDLLVALFTGKEDPSTQIRLVHDLILWPSDDVVTQWIDRWAVLPQKLLAKLEPKIGMLPAALIEATGAPSPAIQTALQRARYGIRRQLVLPTGYKDGARQHSSYDVVIATPSEPQWRAWKAKLKAPGADAWEPCRTFVASMVKAVDGNDIGAILDRWPGVAATVILELMAASGGAMEVELGEL